MPSSSFGNPFASDVSVHSVTRLLRRTRDIACSVQKRLAIADFRFPILCSALVRCFPISSDPFSNFFSDFLRTLLRCKQRRCTMHPVVSSGGPLLRFRWSSHEAHWQARAAGTLQACPPRLDFVAKPPMSIEI